MAQPQKPDVNLLNSGGLLTAEPKGRQQIVKK